MNYKTALMTASALLLISAPAMAETAPAADAMKAINANYALVCTAVLDPTDANIDTAFGSMSPDYVNLTLKGKKLGKDEIVAGIKQQLKQFHGTACDNTLDAPNAPDANTVVVVVTQKISGDFQGPDGKHQIDSTQKTEDTWKLVGGKWTMMQGKDLRSLLKIDGAVQDDEGQ